MINPLIDFKSKVSYFTRAKLTAQTSMQITERTPYSAMDDFLPDEMRKLRETGQDFYIEPKMTAESFL